MFYTTSDHLTKFQNIKGQTTLVFLETSLSFSIFETPGEDRS